MRNDTEFQTSLSQESFFIAEDILKGVCKTGGEKMKKLFTSESVTEGHPDKV